MNIQLHAHQLHINNCWGINCVIIPAPMVQKALIIRQLIIKVADADPDHQKTNAVVVLFGCNFGMLIALELSSVFPEVLQILY